MEDFLKYIDWQAISEDNNLTSGDISPEDSIKLEEILGRFVKENS